MRRQGGRGAAVAAAVVPTTASAAGAGRDIALAYVDALPRRIRPRDDPPATGGTLTSRLLHEELLGVGDTRCQGEANGQANRRHPHVRNPIKASV
jgi:hypothetical protein